jgi:hypothetical protein
MRVLRLAFLCTLLAAPGNVLAQTPNINLMPELHSKTPEEKEAEAERDKAYKESLRKIPDAKTSSDPWGSVRGGETAKAATPVKPTPVKPRTKAGGTQTRTEAH